MLIYHLLIYNVLCKHKNTSNLMVEIVPKVVEQAMQAQNKAYKEKYENLMNESMEPSSITFENSKKDDNEQKDKKTNSLLVDKKNLLNNDYENDSLDDKIGSFKLTGLEYELEKQLNDGEMLKTHGTVSLGSLGKLKYLREGIRSAFNTDLNQQQIN
ncbi:hypothetical protein BDAP_001572 [Binucleata daphniae]